MLRFNDVDETGKVILFNRFDALSRSVSMIGIDRMSIC